MITNPATPVVPSSTNVPHGGSYVDWPAIFAGGVVTSAVAFLLTAFGSALGLSMVSPYRESTPSVWIVIAIGLWILWVSLGSFMAGGYLTGRLRRRVADATEHEVHVRDGVHGIVVWAVAALLGAALLVLGVYGTSNVAVRGASAAASAAATTAATQSRGTDESPYGLVADRLFVGGEEATRPGGDVARRTVLVLRIVGANAVAGRKLADADRTFLTKLVASRAGVDEPTAQARVDEAQKQADEIAAKAKEAANVARKIGIVSAFLIAVSLLIGGAAAYWAATLGGRHRDEQVVHSWMRWR